MRLVDEKPEDIRRGVKQFFLYLLLMVVALAALMIFNMGCSVYQREDVKADGSYMKIREYTGIFMNKESGFSDSHEWLDEATNSLHQVKINRNSKENADAQVAIMGMLIQELSKAYGLKYATPPAAAIPMKVIPEEHGR